MPKNRLFQLGAAALLLAWAADLLFWAKEPGISFPLFVLLVLGVGLFFAAREGAAPSRASLLLLAPALFFTAMTCLRLEPFTRLLNHALAFGSLALLATTWLGGQWWNYSLVDYLINGLRLGWNALALPAQAWLRPVGGSLFPEGEASQSGARAQAEAAHPGFRPALSVFFGLGLALPVVSLLALLLSSADPIFAQKLGNLFGLLALEELDEYLIRLAFIAILAYLLCGAFLYALFSSRRETLTGMEKPLVPPFLGLVEAGTVLACVDLLFAAFVAVQLRYFFGGEANIRLDGFTYAEYARRGFGELLAVAFISLLLFLSLSQVTRREAARSRRVFSGLGLALVALVVVILVSAFQRLLLYEGAYGFTRIRTYTHVFMLWLGLLLAATIGLELAGRLRRFALVAQLAGFLFTLSLNLVNVDSFIAYQNIARAARGEALDIGYLAELSDDAVPALFERFQARELPDEVRVEVGAALACRAALERESQAGLPWQSFHPARAQARRLFEENEEALATYPVSVNERLLTVKVNGEELPCRSFEWID